jgi:hypothetical protein
VVRCGEEWWCLITHGLVALCALGLKAAERAQNQGANVCRLQVV